MSKRPFVWAVLSFVFGILCSLYRVAVLPAGLLLLFVTAYGSRRYRNQSRRYTAIIFLTFLFFSAGILKTKTDITYRSKYLHCLEEEQEVLLQGEVCGKEEKEDQFQIRLQNVILQADYQYHTNQVLVYLNTDEYPIGTTLVIKGNIQKFHKARNEGGFDEESYYRSKKIDYRLHQAEVIRCCGKESKVGEALYLLKKRLRESIRKNMGSRSAGVLSAMILGDKSLLEKEVRKIYQKTGIAHILAISGLHISFVGMGLYRIMRKLKRSIYSSAACSVLFLFLYVRMTGSGVSAVRASVMFVILMLGKCVGRTYDRITALAVSVFHILYENPFLIGDSGFLFSVAAILGVVFAGEGASAWKVSGMIQLMTLPLVAYNYFEIFLPSLLFNMIILPLVPFVVFGGMLGAGVGIFWRSFAKIILMPPHFLLTLFELTGQFAASFIGMTYVTGRPGMVKIFIYYFCLGVWLVLRNRRGKSAEKNRKASKQRIAAVGKKICKMAAGLCVLWAVLSFHVRKNTKIDVLDVGQGDGICIQEKGGVNIFIDGGSSDEKQLGAYTILPYLKCNGLSRVDYWFLSHADTDHLCGLLEVLENGYRVCRLVLSAEGIVNDNAKKLIELAERQGTEVLYMSAGERLRMKHGDLCCIFPDREYESTDVNAKSMVLLYEERSFKGLFTGDIGKEEEYRMLERANFGPIDFYKAAHHGSKNSNGEEWLAYLHPAVSVISCAEGNSYGHPGKEAVENIENAASDIYYTMEGGQISVSLSEHRMEITNFRNPLEVHRYSVIE